MLLLPERGLEAGGYYFIFYFGATDVALFYPSLFFPIIEITFAKFG